MSANGGDAPTAPSGGGSKRLAQQQAQVDEVVDIMRENVDKVLKRDQNLSLLDDRADKLQHNAAQFEQHAGKLKRKYWWKNMKMMIVMGVVGTIFAIVVIAWIASKVKAVAPALPAGSAATPMPSINAGVPQPPPRTGSPKKAKSKGGKSKSKTSTAASAKNDEGSPNDEEVAKVVSKRAIRQLLHKTH